MWWRWFRREVGLSIFFDWFRSSLRRCRWLFLQPVAFQMPWLLLFSLMMCFRLTDYFDWCRFIFWWGGHFSDFTFSFCFHLLLHFSLISFSRFLSQILQNVATSSLFLFIFSDFRCIIFAKDVSFSSLSIFFADWLPPSFFSFDYWGYFSFRFSYALLLIADWHFVDVSSWIFHFFSIFRFSVFDFMYW